MYIKTLRTREKKYIPPFWSTGTDAEITEALQKHYAGEIDLTEYWSVGDERTIHLSAMDGNWNGGSSGESHVDQDATFVIMNVGGKTLANSINGHTECAFIVGMKDMLTTGSTYEEGYMNPRGTNAGGWNECARRTWCNNVFYNAIPASIRHIFKQHINKTSNGRTNHSQIISSVDYFAFTSEKEIFNTTTYANATAEADNTQWEYYKTAANRIKYRAPNGNPYYWWERSPNTDNDYRFCVVLTNGSPDFGNSASVPHGISPFGCI